MVSEYVFHQPDSVPAPAAEGEDVNSRLKRAMAIAPSATERSGDANKGQSSHPPDNAVNAGLTMAMRSGGVESSVGKLSLAILGGLFFKDAADRMNKPARLSKSSMSDIAEVARTHEHMSAKTDARPLQAQTVPKTADETAKTADRKPADKAEKSERELSACWRKTQSSIDQAVTNRGRETNAFKSLHDYLKALGESQIGESAKQQSFELALAQVSRIKDWDRPQWFRSEPSNWRDPSGKRMTEHDFIRCRNAMTREQIKPWDEWAKDATKQFKTSDGTADQKIAALDDYLVRRVSVDSVKNWLRRRPDEVFVNEMFAALAENKLYIGDDKLRVRCLKDTEGNVKPVEVRDGKLYFEGSDEEAPVKEDARGRYVELPDDSDMVVFERRTVNNKRQIVPISQPNDRDPNIQWFGGAQVKRGWQKEQRFLEGPQAFSPEELYGFFPDHFPMRVTNSVESGKPTEKTGAAVYGYARDHAGRQARQLIADFGEVMDGLKRNNSQLINDARIVFGLQKATKQAIEFDSPYPTATKA
jgi:hypothetical protein